MTALATPAEVPSLNIPQAAASFTRKTEGDPTDPPTPPAPLKLERSVVEALMAKIDPTLTREAFNGIFVRAGATEAAALESLYKSLRKLVLNAVGPIDAADVREMNEALVAAIDGGVHGRIVNLGGLAVDALAQLMTGEIGARYAMNNGLSFALVGNNNAYEIHNRDFSLNRFDPNTGERLMSDAYLRDRASYFAVRLAAGPGASAIDVEGAQSWIFDDRHTGGVRIAASAANAERAGNRMTFGADEDAGEQIAGGNGNDRLYGGGGDDTMRGGAGDDYIEGGRGNDYLVGGRGDDTLEGGVGEDELDGGFGNDKLLGGAGADDLTGGRGDDRMEGGDGFDTYNIEAGDGVDTIVDSDGKGVVLLEGKAITGAMQYRNGLWLSEDSLTTFSFAGDPVEGGTLTIQNGTNTIKLHQFRNGMLGMTFGDGKPESIATFAGGTQVPADDNIVQDYDAVRYNRDLYNFSTVDLVDQRSPRLRASGTVAPAGNTDVGVGAVTASYTGVGASPASASDVASPAGTISTRVSTDLTGNNAVNGGSALFGARVDDLRYVTGAVVSRALAESDSRMLTGNSVSATDTPRAAQAQADLGHAMPFVSAQSVQHALSDFSANSALASTEAGTDAADAGAGGIDLSITDRALARLGGINGDAFGSAISTDLKPAEIGLGTVGLK